MRTIFILFISLITINLSAQEEMKSKRISTGVKVGSEIGFMTLDNKVRNSNSELDLGYSIIVDFVEYDLNNNFSINLGVGFTNRNYRQNVDNMHFVDIFAQASAKETLLIQNIEIPLTAKYYFSKKDGKRHFYLLGGSTVYYKLHDASQQELFFSDGTVIEYNHQQNLKRTTFAATLGAGLQFDTNYQLSYVLESILQVNPNNVNFHYGRDSNILMSLGLMAGVKF